MSDRDQSRTSEGRTGSAGTLHETDGARPDGADVTRPDGGDTRGAVPGGAADGTGGTARRPLSARRRRGLAVLVGVVVAGVLAAVLFSGRSGSSTSNDVAPGIPASEASVLTLDVFGSSSGGPAPDFTLTDQHGQAVSLSQFRGKAVVLSFNDDQCPDLCPLLAQDIVAAHRDLGSAASDVVFLSVNVNPYYPQVSAVKQWTDTHGLGSLSDWVFTTGTPAQLRAVWKLYGAEVELDPSTRTVVHSTGLYFIGPGGHERAFGQFGTNVADTAVFGHGLAQMAVDLLPASRRVHVGGPSEPPASSGTAALGAAAPPFDLPALAGGGTLSLAGDRGHDTVVNFWSSTCTACKSEMPALELAHKRLGPAVDFVGVDVADRASAARAFATQAGVTYPLAADRSGSVAGRYAVTGLPYTVVVGPTGKILVRHPGTLTTEEMVYVMQNLAPKLGG